MQAILTKHIGATNTKPSRIKAYSASGLNVTINFPYLDHEEDNYRAAAVELCEKYGWKGELVGGSTKEGYAFVFMP